MKKLLKKIIGGKALLVYHALKAKLAAWRYGRPADRMVVIGITGTKGKSTSANFIWAGLTGAGVPTGILSTANIRIKDRELPNPFHMTMPGPMIIQKYLKDMADSGCKAVIVETTSQGIVQHRHRGISYDILVFTNLTPEHIESHGSFEKYRAAKQIIFQELVSQKRKDIPPFGPIPKMVLVNCDSPEASAFLVFDADRKVTFGMEGTPDILAKDISETSDGISYAVDGKRVDVHVFGRFNVLNTLPAIGIGRALKLDEGRVIEGLRSLASIPGRMEVIQRDPFYVIVDYAHEPASLTQALSAARGIANRGKVIVLTGAAGGRDSEKRPVMGKIAAEKADYVVVADEDPFDEVPGILIDQVADGAARAGKTDGKDLFRLLDRREGIGKCLSLAEPGDVVIITGKGAEQSIVRGSVKVPWDDRNITRELLRK